jgi:hypothetical protein
MACAVADLVEQRADRGTVTQVLHAPEHRFYWTTTTICFSLSSSDLPMPVHVNAKETRSSALDRLPVPILFHRLSLTFSILVGSDSGGLTFACWEPRVLYQSSFLEV